MKPLIVYYSYSGNTKRTAEILRRETGADLAEIQTAVPYTGDYNTVVDQGKREVESGFLPGIKPLSVDLSAYDRILLGSPVWWYTFAPAMSTFLQENSLSGKEIFPFATNGGWLGHTFADFEKACPGAKMHPGLNIRFNEDKLRTPEEEIIRWAKSIK